MIQSICVCGAGTMGAGIAQIAAQSGFNTILFDVNEAVVAKAKEGIEKNLQFLEGKNKITAEQKAATIARLHFTHDLQTCIADIIIEAIVENPTIKISLFNQLAVINKNDTIFASNTSSLSVSMIAEGIVHPERVAGMHFFNPAPVMKLVEVVKATQTKESVVQQLCALAKQMGKTPVVCKDAPGFIVNRVARPYYIESLRIAEEATMSLSDIDTLLEATGFKMGPFRLMDLIGNDVNYAVSCSVYEQLGKPERLLPSYIQEEKVKAGELGKKSGRGYYTYN